MVCCSGVNNSGSLSVIQNGLEFYKEAFIPIDGVQKIWSLNLNGAVTMFGYNKIMVLSTINSTRIFYHKNDSNDELKEGNPSNILDLKQPTILFSYLGNGNILQITPTKILLTSLLKKGADVTWSPPQGTTIQSAVMDSGYIVIACTHGHLIVFQLNTGYNGFNQLK